MFWADRIAREIQETSAAKSATKDAPLIVRDEKTLSGRVHVGSMRGVAIHGLVAEVLTAAGVPNKYLYEWNDFDPFDSIPGYLDQEKFKEHLGKPLYTVPSPEPGFDNYAEYFGADFKSVHEKAGFFPEYYRTYKDLYAAGKMDSYIRTALERKDDIRRILKEVSGSVKDESWLPVSIVCEKCGKMMTTRAHDFDGETVGYTCDKSPDDTVPCGHTGRVAPWKGAAKLFWKVDWAAKWAAVGVQVEGAGKDHSTKGGSRDVSNHIAKDVYGYQSPFDIPYEFFLVGGKKMSSSKGRGSSAKDMSDLFPANVFRLALLGKDINQQIDVDPAGDSIPRMFDWYDELAQKVREGVSDDFTRLYELAQLPGEQAAPATPWQMRFSEVAFIVQMPHLNIETEAERVKGGALTEEEKIALAERAQYAKFWLATYAPERYIYKLQDSLPEVALTDAQKKALAALHAFVAEKPRSGEELHARLHELKTEIPIEPKELFSALYRVFLGRESGPKAGWFLSVLPHEFLVERLKAASA
jgi:lysyl-tRNA synthetase class 1